MLNGSLVFIILLPIVIALYSKKKRGQYEVLKKNTACIILHANTIFVVANLQGMVRIQVDLWATAVKHSLRKQPCGVKLCFAFAFGESCLIVGFYRVHILIFINFRLRQENY